MKRKRETIWIPIVIGFGAIAAFVAVSLWTYGISYRYKSFRTAFAADVNVAVQTEALLAESDGCITRLSARNSDLLYREIIGGKYRKFIQQVPQGDRIALDFGNGSTMRIWPYEEGGLTIEYVQAEHKPVVLITDDDTRFLNVQKLVSVEWGNVQAEP